MKPTKHVLACGMLAAAVTVVAPSAIAQQINGVPGSPDATQVINGNQIPGTAVDDSYELPFKFTGTIDKLTFKLGPSQLMAVDQKAVDEMKKSVDN